MKINEIKMSSDRCPVCGGPSFSDLILAEKKDACYHKIKATAKVWPSAYASGRLVQCRKKGAANYGNKSEGVEEVDESGLQYHTGVKKHGKEYMIKAAAAGREGASQKELGALKDKYSKAYKEDSVSEGEEDRTSYQVAKILADRGMTYDPTQENELINAIGMVLVKELMMTPKQARYLISYDEDFVSDTMDELRSMQQSVPKATDDKSFGSMMRSIKKGTAKQATADRRAEKEKSQQQARAAFGNMFGGGNPADKLGIRKPPVLEGIDELARVLELSGLNLTPDEQFDIIEDMVESVALEHGVDAETIWEEFESVEDDELFEAAAWQKKSGKNKNGGLNARGVAAYRRENPGSKLQTAVTTKPSKLKPGSKAAKRRKSFCARMGGMKGAMKQPNGKPTRKALALRKWNC